MATRTVHGKTINDVLNTPGLSGALTTGFNNAVENDCEYGGLVYETNGVLGFKGPKKGDKVTFGLEVYVRDNAPKGANDNLVAVWHAHPSHTQARTCRPSDDDIDNAKKPLGRRILFRGHGFEAIEGGQAVPSRRHVHRRLHSWKGLQDLVRRAVIC
ncbi:hypothetical protein SCHPADRAFT_750774 [Schizopora paradoxa]|uniref:DUF4329 domain-containing protein n=1 Tax=Schizopora paradoxa TaxID=27342 RepID=A0A0H2RI99_9AGAM|nr:hypothetical protein SCHPADRAFT_750774 [Schizopora paradoxa]